MLGALSTTLLAIRAARLSSLSAPRAVGPLSGPRVVAGQPSASNSFNAALITTGSCTRTPTLMARMTPAGGWVSPNRLMSAC